MAIAVDRARVLELRSATRVLQRCRGWGFWWTSGRTTQEFNIFGKLAKVTLAGKMKADQSRARLNDTLSKEVRMMRRNDYNVSFAWTIGSN